MSCFFLECEWLYNMYLHMREIMYISNLFLCCVCVFCDCLVFLCYYCVSFLNVYNRHTKYGVIPLVDLQLTY